ncbi:hypothetical protein E3N88_07561 [Mikania micrantha]|uniref:Protein kinase domain-containing protein n=1 Tax=Mikania micrantha TaxID=192012 RepID=A0A5N6PTX6_9ASTR|nr:hypothetical protein E3N88_07561 [Mikania micrantha]
MLIILACFAASSCAVRTDIDCLRSIKESLEDPEQLLSSWDFNNSTEGFICRFTGVECWHPDESRVLNIDLSDMGLGGSFPIGIRSCTSLTGLDLSGNKLTGQIPYNVADVVPFLTTLDLSNNNLSGSIPPSIANISLINVLRLDNNQFTGHIPPKLSELDRLKEFSVANNRLSGQVPIFRNYIIPVSAESYANNLGLCGAPLSPCKHKNHVDIFFSGFAVGLPVSTILTVLLIFCLPRLSMKRYYLLMIKKIKERQHHLIPRISQAVVGKESNLEERKVTDWDKYIRALSLIELKMATNDFDTKNVIGYGNMGLMYKAMFQNGIVLAVKRLHKFESLEKEFSQEIKILGRLRHTNLVPLMSYCFEMEKKFLIYKYMSNGTLYQWLHSRPQVEGKNKKMGWTLRLRIAVGIARGLAWLHHNNILRVAHLKISSNCVLLDDKFEPKISNFGNSNLLMSTNSTISSGCNLVVPHSSVDPYKEDVYGFGILLFEIISGKERSSAETDTDSLIYNICSEQCNMIDECLTGRGFDDEIYETLRIADSCIRTHKDGATSMLQVYQAIRAIGISRNEISIDS